MPQDPETLQPLLDAVKLRRNNGADALLTGGPEAIIAVNSEREKSQVSRSSVVASLKPTRKTWASPITRAMMPPTGSLWSFSMGHDKTPRRAFARMFARVRWFAVRNHHRLPICARRLSAQPPT